MEPCSAVFAVLLRLLARRDPPENVKFRKRGYEILKESHEIAKTNEN